MSATVTCSRCGYVFVGMNPKSAVQMLAHHVKERHDLGRSEEERQALQELLR